MDKNEFSASFPDQASLNTFSKLTTMGLALYGYKIKISKTNVDPAASSILHTAWIRISGVPSFARKEEVIKEIISLVAEPIKVDVSVSGPRGLAPTSEYATCPGLQMVDARRNTMTPGLSWFRPMRPYV